MVLSSYSRQRIGLMVVMCLISITTHAIDFETADATFQGLTSEQDKLAWVKKHEPEVSQWSVLNQAYFYHRKGLALEVNDDIEGAKEQFVKSVQLFKSLDEMDPGLVASLIDLSYMKYLQTNNTEVYCSDREEAVDVARKLNHPQALSGALIQLSFCYQNGFDDLSQGLAVLEEAAEVTKKNKLTKDNLAMIYNATGNLYRGNQIHQQAYDYYKKAYQLWVKMGDTQDVFNMLHNMSSEAIALGEWSQAESHVKTLYDMAEMHTDFSDFEFFAEFNAGRLAYEQQKFSQAVQAYEAALALKKTTPEHYFVKIAEGELAVAYFRLGQYDKAFQAVNNYLSDIANSNEIDKMLEAVVIDFYSQQNHPEAMQKFWQLLDKTRANNRHFVKNAVALQTLKFNETIDDLQSQASDQQLAIKELELEQQQKQARINQLTTLVVSLFALVAVIIAWFFYRAKKHHQLRARTDYLTGIANRRYIIKEGRRLLAECQKQKTDLSIIIVDIDDFKPINDDYGHAAGDVVIQQIVSCMRKGLSDGQILGRVGGEEFLMLLPNTSKGRAHSIAETIRQQVANKTIRIDQTEINRTVSLGVAVNQPPVADFEELLKRADEAMYQAKNAGKNQVQSATVSL